MQHESVLTLERRRSLAEQVADTLVESIGLGEMKPGERVVETEMAQRLKVSRVPVREAFKILATQGILEGEPNRGVRVARIDDVVIGQICEARLAVETLALRSLALEPTCLPALGRALEARIADMAHKVDVHDLIGVNRADVAYHTQICLMSGNRIVHALWEAMARHVWIVFGREILSERSLSAIVGQHRDLARAILHGPPERAIAELETHVFRLRAAGRPHLSARPATAPDGAGM